MLDSHVRQQITPNVGRLPSLAVVHSRRWGISPESDRTEWDVSARAGCTSRCTEPSSRWRFNGAQCARHAHVPKSAHPSRRRYPPPRRPATLHAQHAWPPALGTPSRASTLTGWQGDATLLGANALLGGSTAGGWNSLDGVELNGYQVGGVVVLWGVTDVGEHRTLVRERVHIYRSDFIARVWTEPPRTG